MVLLAKGRWYGPALQPRQARLWGWLGWPCMSLSRSLWVTPLLAEWQGIN